MLPTPVFWGFPCGSAGKESACNVGDQGLIPGLGRSPGEGKSLPTPLFWPGEFHGLYSHGVAKSRTRLRAFPCTFTGGSNGKESARDIGDLDSNSGSGRSAGAGNGNPLQYSCLENPMDRGAWRAAVHGVTKSWTLLLWA